MRSIGVIVFAAVAFGSFPGIICNPVDRETEIKPNCDLYSHIPGIGLACKRMSKPVCGTNGQTYTNECELCSDKLKLKKDIKIKHENSCKDDCQGYGPVCTREHNPVCGSDSVTYDNKCMFCNAKIRNADLLIVSNGECKPKDDCQRSGRKCTMDYNPVCGSDSVTYSNKCMFCNAKIRNADLLIVSNGKCQTKDDCQRSRRKCTLEYNPVCGSDSVTYDNKCMFCNAKIRNADLLIVSNGECKPKDDCQGYGPVCTMEHNPVCGSDSVTYSNKCMFCNAKTKNADLLIVSNGECKPKDECEGYGEFCTFIYSPVCGSNAVTYGNMCNFCGAKRENPELKVVSNGDCEKKTY